MSGFHIKTVLTLLITLLVMTGYHSAFAQDLAILATPAPPSASESYLKDIRDTLLININKLPIYLGQLTKLSLSWLAPDDSSATASLQNSFTTLTNARLQNARTQSDSQIKLLGDFLGNPTSQDSFPNANDISYQTLLNQPYFPINPRSNADPAYTYTQYAAGLNIRHIMPSPNWVPNKPAIAMYMNYYNTASAVQTYNGYILSELYSNSKNNNSFKQTQDSLVQQASNSTWFTQIASENIGVVLRQILLYNSQTYVLLADLLETQKKLLAAQAMNNALLVAVNQEAENRLYSKAANRPPV
jgi:hypothetical protein